MLALRHTFGKHKHMTQKTTLCFQLEMEKFHAIFVLSILDVRGTHHADSVDEGQEGVEVHVRVAVRLCHLK